MTDGKNQGSKKPKRLVINGRMDIRTAMRLEKQTAHSFFGVKSKFHQKMEKKALRAIGLSDDRVMVEQIADQTYVLVQEYQDSRATIVNNRVSKAKTPKSMKETVTCLKY